MIHPVLVAFVVHQLRVVPHPVGEDARLGLNEAVQGEQRAGVLDLALSHLGGVVGVGHVAEEILAVLVVFLGDLGFGLGRGLGLGLGLGLGGRGRLGLDVRDDCVPRLWLRQGSARSEDQGQGEEHCCRSSNHADLLTASLPKTRIESGA